MHPHYTKVSRSQALELARVYCCSKHPAWKVCDLEGVMDTDEIQRQGASAASLFATVARNCWFAYVDPMDGFYGIRGSTVIAVSKVTGQILYAGSASDEG